MALIAQADMISTIVTLSNSRPNPFFVNWVNQDIVAMLYELDSSKRFYDVLPLYRYNFAHLVSIILPARGYDEDTISGVEKFGHRVWLTYMRAHEQRFIRTNSSSDQVHLQRRENGHPIDATLDAFPTLHALDQVHNTTAQCAICLEAYLEDDIVVVPCHNGHHFHRDCVKTWLQRSSTCPLCRRDLFPNHKQITTNLNGRV